MGILIIGLVLFLGLHSVRIVAEDWRAGVIARFGEGPWKGIYSVLAVVGLVLVVWGYGEARLTPLPLWESPRWTRHLAALLMLPALVLLVAAYVPANHLKARLGHPMLLAVKVWALAHLLANNTLADLLLFGGFLVWAVFDFRAARRRDASVAARPPGPPRGAMTALTLGIGAAAWTGLAFGGHRLLFGVSPFGA